MTKSELLLPVGDMTMLLAAIHNGADAVYMGVPFFNARGRTKDFNIEDLKEMIELAHLYGVHVHLAFNVLIFQNELKKAEQLLRQIIPLGPDAFIVQDLGLASLIREISPEQVIHGSTQMTITNHDAIELLDDLNIQRFVLGREVSIPEMRHIRKNTERELEAFVHGALCVAYSGQCFTSESIGGRSANRGQCAQSCRFEYQMLVDGRPKDLLDRSYIVSPQDLCGLAEIPTLQEMGIESFKVEGRLKSPEFVASVARSYRDAIDKNKVENYPLKVGQMARTFSRGFFSGWLHGVNHQELVNGNYGSHRGELLGNISDIHGKNIIIKTNSPINKGDGLLFVSHQSELGGFAYQVETKQNKKEVQMGRDFPLSKLQKGMKVFLNKDVQLEKELSQTFTNQKQLKKIPLKLIIKGELKTPLSIQGYDNAGHSIELQSSSILEPAKSAPLGQENIKSALGGLGHTCFSVEHWDIQLKGDCFLHQKELKNLKKEMVQQFSNLRITVKERPLFASKEISKRESKEIPSSLNILIRNKDQIAALKSEAVRQYQTTIGKVILDYEFGKDYIQSVKDLKELGYQVYIATTRILKPMEYHNLKVILRANPDGVLVRNLGALQFFKQQAPELGLCGDFSLNVANSKTADYLFNKGLESLSLSYDLNHLEVEELLKNSDANKLEITVHQYMPEFHMEHCVFASTLSKGSSFKDCGKPCEKHKVEVIDPYGNHHVLAADQECRNTMFSATPYSASQFIENWQKAGVGHYRLEALGENSSELQEKILAYLLVLNKKEKADMAFKGLGLLEKYGVSSGQIAKTSTYQNRKKNF